MRCGGAGPAASHIAQDPLSTLNNNLNVSHLVVPGVQRCDEEVRAQQAGLNLYPKPAAQLQNHLKLLDAVRRATVPLRGARHLRQGAGQPQSNMYLVVRLFATAARLALSS